MIAPDQRPTTSEVKNSEDQILHLTSPHGWDPYSTDTISTQHMLNFTYSCQISAFTVNSKIGDNTKSIVPENSLQKSTLLNPELLISDKWDVDVSMLPYELSSEENAMEQFDEFVGTQIPIDTKSGPALVKVISRKQFNDGTLVGTKHDEPIIDSRLYNVRFPDGHFE